MISDHIYNRRRAGIGRFNNNCTVQITVVRTSLVHYTSWHPNLKSDKFFNYLAAPFSPFSRLSNLYPTHLDKHIHTCNKNIITVTVCLVSRYTVSLGLPCTLLFSQINHILKKTHVTICLSKKYLIVPINIQLTTEYGQPLMIIEGFKEVSNARHCDLIIAYFFQNFAWFSGKFVLQTRFVL